METTKKQPGEPPEKKPPSELSEERKPEFKEGKNYFFLFGLVVLLMISFVGGWVTKGFVASSDKITKNKLERTDNSELKVLKVGQPGVYVDQLNKKISFPILAGRMFVDPPCDVAKTPIAYNSSTEVFVLDLSRGEVRDDLSVSDLGNLAEEHKVHGADILIDKDSSSIFKKQKVVAKKIWAMIKGTKITQPQLEGLKGRYPRFDFDWVQKKYY